jgi:hypothetical protein
MRSIRALIGIVIVAGMLALSACAAPDVELGDLEAELSGIGNVNDATATLSHPGGAGHTEVAVTLYVDDVTDAAVVRAAASVLAADPEVSRHRVSMGLLQGTPSDFTSDQQRSDARIRLDDTAAAELGLQSGHEFIVLSPDRLSRLAGEG